MDDKFKNEKLNRNVINDNNLIIRIWKNTKRNSFNYLDSVDILKNKIFTHIQLLSFVGILLLISFILIKLKIILGYLLIALSILFAYITYLKLNKLNKLVEKERNSEKIKILNEEIKKSWKNLLIQMKKVSLEETTIEYTKNLFTEKINKCKTEEDYKNVLRNINDEIKKYKKISKDDTYEFYDATKNLTKIEKAYRTLKVERGTPLEEIKMEYRKLVKIYHPDNQNGDETKALEINEAYNILKEYLK